MEVIPKPWGRELVLEINDNYVVKLLEVNPGQSLSLQYHEIKKETMYCLEGHGTLYHKDHDTDHEVLDEISPGAYVTIYPFDIHRLTARDDKLLVLECSSPELDDVVRLEDNYGRS